MAASVKTTRLLSRRPKRGETENRNYHVTLSEAGIRHHYHPTVHAKIVIIDRAVAIVSSLNFFSQAEGGKSWEAGIVTLEPALVESVVDECLKLFESPDSKRAVTG